MESKDFISRGKLFFRDLRKGNEKLKTEIRKEIGISFPTMDKILPQLLSNGPLKKSGTEKLTINPDYQSFAGVYVSKDTIYLSVIDFAGKEIYFETKHFGLQESFFESLREILKLCNSTKAVSICSDEYVDFSGNAQMYDNVFLDERLMNDYIPKELEYYFEKICVTNSLKWYEDTENDELNVIFSFSENEAYYTIIKDGVVIQKRRCTEKIDQVEEFFEKEIFPVWKSINPNNIVFIAPSEKILKLILNNTSKWHQKIIWAHMSINQSFEIRRPTKLIQAKQFHPSESAALYAMYRYYGWTK